jgi:hypothetical protein
MTSGRMVKQVKKQVKASLAMKLYQLIEFAQGESLWLRIVITWTILWKTNPEKFR